jgi:hypothetical protein
MIDKLHNMANAVLGLGSVRYYNNLYRFTFINDNDYTVEVQNSEGTLINPIKESRNNNLEYRLDVGTYYLRCYNIDEDTNTKTKVYFEEIYVSSDMLDMSRTTKL